MLSEILKLPLEKRKNGTSMSLIRPSESCFKNLPNFNFEPNFIGVGEPKIAYLDEGKGDETILCLYGEPTWSFLYRNMIPELLEIGRVIVPDIVGFGRSDRFTEPGAYSFSRFYNWLETFIDELNLTNITLLCHDWGGLVGLTFASKNQDRIARLVPMNAWLMDGTQKMPDEWWAFHDFVEKQENFSVGQLIHNGTNTDLPENVLEGYEAPFPDDDFKIAAKIWPQLIPTTPKMEGAETMNGAIESLSKWEKPTFVLFSNRDPIMSGWRDPLRELIPTATEQPDICIEGAGHYL